MDQYIGRIVVALTPIIAGLSGWLVTVAADVLPGNPELDEAEITALFVAGVLASGGAIFKWLEGRAKNEVAALATGVDVAAPRVPLGVRDPDA